MPDLPRALRADLARRPRVRSLLAIVVEYAWIAACIGAVVCFPHPLLYVLAIVVIGARQHSLLTLLHEAAHRQLTSVRWLNDLCADVFCAWPFLVDLGTYRRFHLLHHKHVNSELDPEKLLKGEWPREWQFPRSRGAALRLLAGDLAGLHGLSFLAYVRRMKRIAAVEHSVGYRVARGATFFGLSVILIGTGTWLHALLFWTVPASTTLICFARLREICEHSRVDGTSAMTAARTTRAPALARFLVAPRNVGYHLEHHLYPNVPWFRLPELHRELLKSAEYREHALITRGGYPAALREITF